MFRDFSNSEIEDFVFDESFQRWVTDGNSDDADFWQRFVEEYPHQVNKVLAARELVLQLKNQQPATDHKELAGIIWTSVEAHIDARERRSFGPFRWWQAAAAVAILLLAAPWTFNWHLSDENAVASEVAKGAEFSDSEILVDYINRQDSTVTVTLADGSTVMLEPSSQLTYAKQFDSKERVVALSGEAFFDVAKDPARPFLIFTDKTVVKVLGTSFRVEARDESKKVVVTVRSGKVSVFEMREFKNAKGNPQMSGLVLTANQRGEFSNDDKFSKTIVAEPVIIDDTDKGEFYFDQTPLSNVFETLEKAYGIDIIYDRELMENRLLKVSLEDESLHEKLDIICKTMGLTYYMIDARIIIEAQYQLKPDLPMEK